MILFLLMFVTGHGFLQCYRDWNNIKNKKGNEKLCQSRPKNLITGAKNSSQPFKVIDISIDCFFYLQCAVDDIIMTKKSIVTACRMF